MSKPETSVSLYYNQVSSRRNQAGRLRQIRHGTARAMNPTPKTTTRGARELGTLSGRNIAIRSAVTPVTMSNRPRNANHRFRLSMRLPLLVGGILQRERILCEKLSVYKKPPTFSGGRLGNLKRMVWLEPELNAYTNGMVVEVTAIIVVCM